MKTYTALFLMFVSLSLMAQNPAYVAHRGASYLAPENTIASITLAFELGADAAECDIMLTKDKEIILFHDKKGKRLTGHDFIVKDVEFEEIRNYPIIHKESTLPEYEGECIPLLQDVLKILPEKKTLVIEIKTGPEILPYLEKIIATHWNSGNLAIIAFDFETILAAKSLFPDIPCYYLSMFKQDIRKKFNVIAESNLDGVNLRHAIITKKLVTRFKAEGKGMWCWTVNDLETARKMIDLGVSAITTDRPKWLKEEIEKQ